jgi:DNA-binding CsgD family transcriptional regulator
VEPGMIPEPTNIRHPDRLALHTVLICRECGGVATFAKITQRNIAILRLLIDGKNNKQIAKELGITVGTVKVYMGRLFDILRVQDRFAAAMWALHHGEQLGLGYRIIKAAASTPAATRNGVMSIDAPRSVESDPLARSGDSSEPEEAAGDPES